MTVDVLSSIKGAKPSDAVSKLFKVIKNANQQSNFVNKTQKNVVSIKDLREDVVVKSTSIEREIIKENFPKEQNGFLVVAKVIED